MTKLTPRETEVLGLVIQGLTNKAIASALKVTDHTIKMHMRNLSKKLGVKNRTRIAVRGVREGLV